MIAQADRQAQVSESNELDNLRVKAISIGPDVVIKSVALTPSPPTSTSPTNITVTTKNAGGATAGASRTRLYRSTNAKVESGDALLADFEVPALAAGTERAMTMTVTLPAGAYYVIAVGDAAATVIESKEGNNTKATKKTVP